MTETTLIELTWDEMIIVKDGGNITKDGWTIGPNGLTLIESSAQKILDGEMDFASWTGRTERNDVVVTLADDADGQSNFDRHDAALHLFTIFTECRGQARDEAQKALHDLGYDVEKSYELIDVEEQ